MDIKDRLKKKKWSVLFGLLAMLIPTVLVIIGGGYAHILPFGNNSFLVSDTNNQFVAFFTYFKHVILSNDSSLYSLSKTLGGDMIGFWGYYLQNPFAVLLLLFPDEKISVGIFWVISLQIGCMGLSCYLFLSHRPSEINNHHAFLKTNLIHLICSWAYALMGYAIAYLTLPIYFCSLILLPLIALGIVKFIDNQRHFLLYAVSLAVAVWCNYYLGYMICIFCILYFVKELILRKEEKLKKSMLLLLKFCGVSCIAVLLDSFCLIPTVLSLSGEKAAPSDSVISLSRLYGFKNLIRNLMPGTFTCGFSNASAPYLYVGVLTLIGCVIYFFASVKKNTKAAVVNVLFLILLVLSTYISFTDVIWHGFNEPVGFAHRQTFIISFCIIILADTGFILISDKISYVLLIIIMGLHVLDLGYNTVSSIQAYQNYEMKSQEEYEIYYGEMSDVITEVKNKDNSLYRLEKDVEYNHNDALLFDYAGLSHNSSCEKDYVREFMGRIGFRNQGIWSFYYQGNTAFSDSLLGVKYFISRFNSTNKPYIEEYNNDKYFAYRNPYALPLGFIVSKDYKDMIPNSQNLFENQNNLAVATGGISDIYTEAEYSVFTEGVTESTAITNGENRQSGLCVAAPNECLCYQKNSTEGKAFIEYEISIDEPCNLYCYFSAPSQQGCNMYVNDFLRDDYFSDYRWAITNLGNYQADDTVKVSLELTGNVLKIYDAYFYKENIDRLQEWYQNVSLGNVNISKENSANYRGKVSNPDDSILVFSVPYEKGMKVLLDGEQAETFMMFDALLAVNLPKGDHDIVLSYFPYGMKTGIIISVISLVCLLGTVIVTNNKSKRNGIFL